MKKAKEFLEEVAIDNSYGSQYECLVELEVCIDNTADGDIPEFVKKIREFLKIKLQEVIEREDE